jgi:hypothetical protein
MLLKARYFYVHSKGYISICPVPAIIDAKEKQERDHATWQGNGTSKSRAIGSEMKYG